MKRIETLVIGVVLLASAGIAALDGQTLPPFVQLVAAAPQNHAVLLAAASILAGIALALLGVARLRTHIDALLNARQMRRKNRDLQRLADASEALRIQRLNELVAKRFQDLDARMSRTSTTGTIPVARHARVAPPSRFMAHADRIWTSRG